MSRKSKAVAFIWDERVRQGKLWGKQRHDLDVWMLILTEEVGELAQAILDREGPKDLKKVQKEATHVAAVAMQIIEAVTRSRENERTR